jgi:hypothetical protein
LPPQAVQVPAAQLKPELQALPPQHGWPPAPHWQVPLTQARFALHMLPLQHGCEAAPHALQTVD